MFAADGLHAYANAKALVQTSLRVSGSDISHSLLQTSQPRGFSRMS